MVMRGVVKQEIFGAQKVRMFRGKGQENTEIYIRSIYY